MPTIELSPATISLLSRAREALQEHQAIAEDLKTINGLIQTQTGIVGSPQFEHAQLTAACAVIIDFARNLDSAAGTGRHWGVDEERVQLEVAFTKIAAAIGRPDLLAKRFQDLVTYVRDPQGAWELVGDAA